MTKISWIIRDVAEETAEIKGGNPALMFDTNGDTIIRTTQGKNIRVKPLWVSGDKDSVRNLIKDRVQAILECAQEESLQGGLVAIFYESMPMEDPAYGGTAGLVETRISLAYTEAKVEGRTLEEEVCLKLGLPTEV